MFFGSQWHIKKWRLFIWARDPLVTVIVSADRPEKTLQVHKLWCYPHPLLEPVPQTLRGWVEVQVCFHVPFLSSRSSPFMTDWPQTRSLLLPCPACEPWELHAVLWGCLTLQRYLECLRASGVWKSQTDSRRKKAQENLLFQPTSVQQVHPFASGSECVESCGVWGQESKEWMERSFKNEVLKIGIAFVQASPGLFCWSFLN